MITLECAFHAEHTETSFSLSTVQALLVWLVCRNVFGVFSS